MTPVTARAEVLISEVEAPRNGPIHRLVEEQAFNQITFFSDRYAAVVIRIHVSDFELASTRIAVSRLWELTASLYLLAQPSVPWPYEEWAARARVVLAEIDSASLDPLLFGPARSPDFLTPAPGHPHRTLAEELERVVATPPVVVRAEIRDVYPDVVPASLAPYLVDAPAAIRRFVRGVTEYWDRAIAPDWPRMAAVVERDVLRRGRSLAVVGADAAFEDLHPRVRWRSPMIELDKRFDEDVSPDGRELVLVPLVFSPGALIASVDEPDVIAISYQVAGVAEIWESGRESVDDRLGLLVGGGRSLVIRELHEPRTTLEIANRVGLAASTISEHLSVLTRAELVTRRRSGQHVYYQLNTTGRSLEALLGRPVRRSNTA